ncbi:MAG: hypothetical protein L0216_03000 [Planctomycetales bacterium]|nr:hypothetical protein [Planctomycetales bacterium]
MTPSDAARALGISALLVAGCGGGASPPPSPSLAPPPPAAETRTVETSAGLSFAVPAAWRSVTPSSGMRVAELRIPAAAGDAEEAELGVFYFGEGQGGGASANIERWVGQFQKPGGGLAEPGAVRERKVGDLEVTTVEVSGRYVAPLRPGAPERHDKPGWRLLGAVVETPKGSFFLKLVGPEKTLAAAAGGFEAAIGSLRLR